MQEEKILDGLNPEQERAVTFGEGPLLIVAGAGTGKTMVITKRIAHLVATKRAKPEEILALTFTDKASAEMEERVDVLIPYGYANIWISTFHAFGDKVLRDHAIDIGLVPDFQVLSSPEQVIFFRENLFQFDMDYYRPLGDPTKFIEAMISLFSRAKDEDVSPGEYLTYVARLEEFYMKDPENEELKETLKKQREIASAYKRYQELLMKEGKVDFGDQVYLTLNLFRKSKVILKKYQERFRYILVDEFQDTNYAQFQLLKLLSQGYKNINVVGDDDQSIYRFRGAAISNILNFKKEFPECKEIVLTRNYRSTQTILDVSYKLITNNNPDRLEVRDNIDKQLISEKGEGEGVRHLHYDTLSSEADGVAKIINDAVSSNNYRYSDFAILVRSNNDADPFLRSLNMLGIPHRFSGSRGLYSREEIKFLISFLKTIANPDDSKNLYYLSGSQVYQLGSLDLTKCLNLASKKKRSLFEIFSTPVYLDEVESITLESKATIEKIIKDIEKYVMVSIHLPTGEVLYKFITESGYLGQLSKGSDSGGDEKIKNIAIFFDILRNFNKIATLDRVTNFVDHLQMLMESGDNPAVAEDDYDADAVNVLTVHKAKGLEFPVVIMVSLIDGRFPWPRRREVIELPEELIKYELPEGDYHLQEERRLFYVGMTRAKDILCLTSARDYGGVRQRKMSRFLFEALDLPKSDVSTLKASPIEVINRSAPSQENELTEFEPIPDSKRIILSYYQIDDYDTCPLKYKYAHILKVPVMQHHSVVYGKALHDAIQEYHKMKLNGRDVREEDLIRVLEKSWVSEGFLTRDHEELRLEAGREALRRFYADQETNGIVPVFIEKEFSFPLRNNRIIGRWDRIDILNGKTFIIDYKSSQVKNQKDADSKAKESLQLSIYALAYNEIHGFVPDEVRLYFIESGRIGRAKKNKSDLDAVKEKIFTAAKGIRARNYTATPSYMVCKYCVFNEICPSSAAG